MGVNVGNGPKVTATAGIGGTAIFTIVSAWSSYKDPIINVSGPSGVSLVISIGFLYTKILHNESDVVVLPSDTGSIDA